MNVQSQLRISSLGGVFNNRRGVCGIDLGVVFLEIKVPKLSTSLASNTFFLYNLCSPINEDLETFYLP